VPVKIIGTMTLNRNPENFFAETEQVAFDPGRLVPGIDFSNDPLLQGRVFSYADTQNYRLGGPNFHELPINRPVNGKHNNQRDGHGKQDILKGNVSYFPNSIGGGCPYHAMLKGEKGFESHAEKIDAKKIRGRSTSFADHFTQARLFFNSQSPAEQEHIISAYSFELSKVSSVEIRTRELAILNQIEPKLAKRVGDNLGIAPPKELDPLTIQFARQNHPEYPIKPKKPEVEKSAALSMAVKPGEGTIATRKVAFLVADGVSKASVDKMKKALEAEGAKAVLISTQVGKLKYKEGGTEDVAHSYLIEASVCYDAVYTPDGDSVKALHDEPDYFHFINEAFRHCKALAFAKGAEELLKGSYIKHQKEDVGLVLESQHNLTKDFIHAMKGHRIWDREKSRKVPV
jgi:catalase